MTSKLTDEKIFTKYVKYVFEQEQRIKESQLSEDELVKLINVVDLEIILKHQNLSLPFIEKYIVPLIAKENQLNATQRITPEKIIKWQHLDDNILFK